MNNEIITTTQSQTQRAQRTWAQAYVAFLLSPKESLMLKIAPVALLLGAPEVIASNFLPIIGEMSDLGELLLWIIVIGRTVSAVQRHIQRD